MTEVSFPSAFARRMQIKLQQHWEEFVSIHEKPSATSIRINPLKSDSRELEKICWTDFGYYLEKRPSFTFDPSGFENVTVSQTFGRQGFASSVGRS